MLYYTACYMYTEMVILLYTMYALLNENIAAVPLFGSSELIYGADDYG